MPASPVPTGAPGGRRRDLLLHLRVGARALNLDGFGAYREALCGIMHLHTRAPRSRQHDLLLHLRVGARALNLDGFGAYREALCGPMQRIRGTNGGSILNSPTPWTRV